MAYQIYLIEESGEYVELDCEDVDFATVFSVADISDISVRKDNITKTIQFKGTPNNNKAFGHLFNLNSTSSLDISNALFFNYNPLRAVKTWIYEDGILLLKGSLRVTDVTIDKDENIMYSTYVTGSFTDFRNLLTDKFLADIDLSDLKHRFTWENVARSWDQRTERFNITAEAFEYKPFIKGEGYTYPFIDYGYTFKKTELNENTNLIHVGNFQPAIYLKEYWDRIFKNIGFTYEIKGVDLQQKFSSLIIPNNSEQQTSRTQALGARAYKTQVQTHDSRQFDIDVNGGGNMYIYLNLDQLQAGAGIIQPYGNYLPANILPQTVFLVNRSFTSNGLISVTIGSFFNKYNAPIKLSLELCERSFVAADDPQFDVRETWSVVTKSNQITIPRDSGITNQTITWEVGERGYDETSQICIRVHVEGGNFILENNNLLKQLSYSIPSAQMRFAKDDDSYITYALTVGDEVIPQAPTGVKQIDFVKSIVQLFNLYVYSDKQRPKHLIFQSYDLFYALNRRDLLPSVSLDWSAKVDYNSPRKNKSNLSLPKKYLFTWKKDNDYLNDSYNKATGEVYGQFRFNDNYGLTDEKKVELIFAPSPMVQYKNTNRIHPAIYQLSSNSKKPSKSEIRLMYYNGLKTCQNYVVAKDIVSGSGGFDSVNISGNLIAYPQAGNYYFSNGFNNMTPADDLHFGKSLIYYFDQSQQIEQCPTAYQQSYLGQVSDLTNPNTRYFECYVMLNENDINALDFKTPVFIDTGEFGNAYFRVLSIEYEGKGVSSRVELMKIA
ncbi:MAG: hypothetical protein ABW007_04045 [Chitinophagaceae bacterium]